MAEPGLWPVCQSALQMIPLSPLQSFLPHHGLNPEEEFSSHSLHSGQVFQKDALFDENVSCCAISGGYRQTQLCTGVLFPPPNTLTSCNGGFQCLCHLCEILRPGWSLLCLDITLFFPSSCQAGREIFEKAERRVVQVTLTES